MPTAFLDHSIISTAACPPGRTKINIYDTEIKGYILETGEGGHKTLAYRYKDPSGRQRQYKICNAGDLSPAAARKQAEKLRSRVATGDYPGAAKALAKSIPLYRDIAADHLAYARQHLRAHDSVEMNLRVHLLPKFGKMRVNDITRALVAQFLAEKRAAGLAPATVEKLRVVLGRSFELAAQAGVPGCDKNPTRGLPKKPLNNSRSRYLTAEESVRLHAAVADSQNPQLASIVGMLLFTGARLGELLGAKWADVHVDRRSWYVPDSKTGKARWVPLSTPAVAIIEALPRFKDCPWLVPNPDTLKPYVSIKHGWQRAIKVAKLPGLRIHDLRHSAASFMVNSGVDLFAVGKVLGHASYQSTQRYAHLANDTLLAAVEAGAAKQTAA